MQERIIRLATPDDADRIQNIYAPYVRDTSISFEYDTPTVAEMRQRIENTIVQLPWLVLETGGEIAGYVYAGPHASRAAYRWSVDVSVYVDGRHHRTGAGRALYLSLFEILRLQGYYNAYAGVTLPNAASVGIHESMGFVPVGVYRDIGYKFGLWHSVGWWQLELRARAAEPAMPLPLPEAMEQGGWQGALSAGLADIYTKNQGLL